MNQRQNKKKKFDDNDFIFDPFAPETRIKNLMSRRRSKENVSAVKDIFLTAEKKTVDGPVLFKKSRLKIVFLNLTLFDFFNFIFYPAIIIFNFIWERFKLILLKRRLLKKYVQNGPEEVCDIFSPKEKFLGLIMPFGWHRALSIFLVILIFMILPFVALNFASSVFTTREKVMNLSEDGYSHLQQAGISLNSLEFDQASKEFNEASLKFSQAKREVEGQNLLFYTLSLISPEFKNVKSSGTYLLSAGENLSQAGYYIMKGLNKIYHQRSGDLGARISFFNDNLSNAILAVAKASENISKVDLEQFSSASFEIETLADKDISELQEKLGEFNYVTDAVLEFLGENDWQRYLLIFQNNNEIRATGGFMGSFALIDLKDGKIKNLEVPGGGTYDLQGQLKVAVSSPQPLTLINPRWEFQDANWWPDFPTAAKKIIWFYENSDGPTVDGVVAINSNVMEDLLEITGPVFLPAYTRTITAGNFEMETQKIVEIEYDRTENKPKEFIGDLAPIIFDRLSKLDQSGFVKLLQVLYNNLQAKNIQFYFSDEDLENLARQLNWAGQMAQNDGDYLSVISTNIAGAKTDAVIDTSIVHEVKVAKDGTATVTLKITKKHNGVSGDNIFTGVGNNDYLRIYTPQGSRLVKASGFSRIPPELFEEGSYEKDVAIAAVENSMKKEPVSNMDIYDEFGKTVFANWLSIKPGEEKSVTVEYELPHKFSGRYSLLLQKQSGKDSINFLSNVYLSEIYSPKLTYPETLTVKNNQVIFTNTIDKDLFYGFTFN
ncbi:DUF4012 domain-containing protein [Candidatus Parcubacteria bacterium]|nr:MAG: DUF4012 domain-containing protein [Candidatus Parcubacteria bacterium]